MFHSYVSRICRSLKGKEIGDKALNVINEINVYFMRLLGFYTFASFDAFSKILMILR
jgi:hypothetical protein